MKKLLLAFSLFYSIASFAQNVGVGEAAPKPAKLHFNNFYKLGKDNPLYFFHNELPKILNQKNYFSCNIKTNEYFL